MAAEFGSSAFGRAYGLSLLFIPLASLAPFAIAKVQETTGTYTPPLLTMKAIFLAGAPSVFCLISDEVIARRPP